MLAESDIWSNKILPNLLVSKLQKNSGSQIVLWSLFNKFGLLVVLDQYLLNTNDICL